MSLSDAFVRAAKPNADKDYKVADGGGLYLLISKGGGKLWRVRYRFAGVEKLLSVGAYPEVGLKEARLRRDEAKRLIANGVDPSFEKKRKAITASLQANNTFKGVAREYIEKLEVDGIAEATRKKTNWLASLLEKDLGNRPIANIEPYEVVSALKKIEKRGNFESAKRARSFASRVFKYAIWTARAKVDPAADVGGALKSPKIVHHAAILTPEGLGGLLRDIEGFEGHMTTHAALRFAPHVFVRPGELRHAEWSEFDFDKSCWRIPASKMKMGSEHVVPLSRQSVGILFAIRDITGEGKYVFPSIRTGDRPMSENTINVALRRLGYTSDEMTGHGFRSTACTLLNESGEWQPDAIEAALAHQDKNKVRGSYNRGQYWAERVAMAQWWSDYLDRLREGA
ncbi:tyrosine-type recombinase/integrase [Asticcacaulis sp. 201]|uniref:tyrosine-type recombinase/integrase n=1 Tax=Asticcacaulis sp. 201 TaxID=3028787 RepID=UPI0029169DEE|nr:integrase arm-type DNA-binding domain-containing protein [Asticcacaulis sp. 201]MDV6333082.1 tyrosine-type recombinase/integrase [Asticcacaulis sp. 201]